MAKKTKILLVEDSPVHAEYIRDAFQALGGMVELTIAPTLSDAREYLADHDPDLAIVDLFLPDGRGIDLLQCEGGECRVPAVILSSQGDEEVAVEAMKVGALDYLVKSPEIMADIPHVVERALREWRHIKARREAEAQVRKLAYEDPLTGLANRVRFLDLLQETLARPLPAGRIGALLFLDLDRFKTINDTLGHVSGDRLLVQTARRLSEVAGERGMVARLGGDEFVILLPSLGSRNEAAVLAGQILKTMNAPFGLGEREVYTSPSIGIALFPTDARDAETLIRYADMAMYAAKESGRNAVRFFNVEMTRKALWRLEMETQLRRALHKGEFFLAYQPKVDGRSGLMTGVEALLRWRNPEGRLVSPEEMLPVAEESGLIHPLWEWSLQEVCTQARLWQSRGYAPLRVSINVPGHKFKDPNVEKVVDRVLGETGLKPDCLELELVEGILMEDTESAVVTLKALKAKGVGLIIDDFGIGCSSLLHLKEFPIDRVKIARHFVCGVPDNPTDTAIVKAIVAMTQKIDYQTIGVGVETADQALFLRSFPCQELQGFYFAPAMSPEEIEALLSAGDVCPFGAGYR